MTHCYVTPYAQVKERGGSQVAVADWSGGGSSVVTDFTLEFANRHQMRRFAHRLLAMAAAEDDEAEQARYEREV